MNRPLIGITVDNKDNLLSSGKYESAATYSRAVANAGGLPLLLAQEVALAEEYVERCDGIVLTGGGDPHMEAFGVPTHPKARPIEPNRQAFELAILDALDRRKTKPALGICLGMQFMALHSGGTLNQHLPDTHPDAAVHQKDNRHPVEIVAWDSQVVSVGEVAGDQGPVGKKVADDQGPVASGRVEEHEKKREQTPATDHWPLDTSSGHWPLATSPSVVSWHRQAVAQTGRLRLVALGPGEVVEAIDDPARPFYVGVQWHPERGGEGPLNQLLFQRFVESCRRARKWPGS